MGSGILVVVRARGRKSRSRLAVLATAALACLVLGSAAAAPAQALNLNLPPKFQATTLNIPPAEEEGNLGYIQTLQYPTAIDFAPDGQMFIAERNGRVKVLSSVDDTTPTLVADLMADVMGRGDRGLLGLKLDPEYPTKPYLYLAYTHDAPIGGQAPATQGDPSGGDFCDESPPFTDCVASGRIVRLTLDPQTDIPVGGVDHPVQQILVESWCQQFLSHSIGDIEFDSSGALLAGGGDGANFEQADNGQFANACGDPEKEGGSLRAQDLRSPATGTDPTDYSGSIIRINRETGEPAPGNPLIDSSDERARRVLAYGLRNPFRFELRPGTDELYVGDVGWYTWEELDRLQSPPAVGQGALNFGWPCYEGDGPEPDWEHLAENGQAPLCQSLYETPGAVTMPIFKYVHATAGLFDGDQCSQLPGSASSGLAFYEPPAGATTDPFPSSYDGAMLMADASRGCIWAMHAGPDGRPDPTDITNFAYLDPGAAGSFTPVDIVVGPDGALYIPSFFTNSIVRIRYFANDQPPVAKLSADRTYGEAPLDVHLDASESSDPDSDHLTYAWDTDGDGEFDDGADSPELDATFNGAQNVKVKVRVTDPAGLSSEAELTVYPEDLGPPAPSITVSAVSEKEWTVGETIEFSGVAPDPDLPGAQPGDPFPALNWNVVIRHCPTVTECHSHPLTSLSGVDHGELKAPSHEYPSHLLLTLTATDDRGLSASTSKELFPKVVPVELRSEPAGVPLTLDAEVGPAPLSAEMIAGGSINVSAPPTAEIGGVPYAFSGWSDGGERAHAASSTGPLVLVASYRSTAEVPPPAPPPAPRQSLLLRSRPEGIRFKLGKAEGSQVTPFRLELGLGENRLVIPPMRTRHGGRPLRFARWSDGSTGRRRAIEPGAKTPRAIFVPLAPRRHKQR